MRVKQDKTPYVETGHTLVVGTQAEFFISQIEVGHGSRE